MTSSIGECPPVSVCPSVGLCHYKDKCFTHCNPSKASLFHMVEYSVSDYIIAVGKVLESKGVTGADPLCLPGQTTEGVIGLQI